MLAAAADLVTRRLRVETQDVHSHLEAELTLLDGDLERDRYVALMQRFYGFHVVLEPRLDAWHENADLIDWPPRRKVGLLQGDLGTLGVDPATVAELPRCPNVPVVTSTAEALGVLYVVEGATLGGRIIAAHLRDSDVPASALSFFTSYGADVGRRWHHWRQVTTDWVGDDGARADAVVAAAVGSFDVLAGWLTSDVMAT